MADFHPATDMNNANPLFSQTGGPGGKGAPELAAELGFLWRPKNDGRFERVQGIIRPPPLSQRGPESPRIRTPLS